MNFPRNFMKFAVSSLALMGVAMPLTIYAQTADESWLEIDCTALVMAERERLLEAGEPITIEYMGAFIDRCMLANSLNQLESVQQQIMQARAKLAAINLRIDERGRVLNSLNQEIAQIERTNAGLVLRIDESRGRQSSMLRQAEAILQNLATQ